MRSRRDKTEPNTGRKSVGLRSKSKGIAEFEQESDIGQKTRAKTMGKAKSPMKKKPKTRETISSGDSESDTPKLKNRKPSEQKTYPAEDEI